MNAISTISNVVSEVEVARKVDVVSNAVVVSKVNESVYDDEDNQINDMMNNLNICETELDYINRRINSEVCFDTIDLLRDTNLISEYKHTKSVKSRVSVLLKLMTDNDIDETRANKIINEYITDLVPPGTKGVIKGFKFNKIVEQTIQNIKLDDSVFEVCFEKQCPLNHTDEIPDWYILEKHSGKLLIGMNQLDLWGGGHQINRGSKYLTNNKFNTNTTKMICVVCNHIQFKSEKNKAYALFRSGFKTDTLCYIKNIERIIYDFFNL